jgi:hypothetical protein
MSGQDHGSNTGHLSSTQTLPTAPSTTTTFKVIQLCLVILPHDTSICLSVVATKGQRRQLLENNSQYRNRLGWVTKCFLQLQWMLCCLPKSKTLGQRRNITRVLNYNCSSWRFFPLSSYRMSLSGSLSLILYNFHIPSVLANPIFWIPIQYTI